MVKLRAPEPCFRSGQARLGDIPEPGLSPSSIIGRNYVTVRQVGTKAQVEAKLYYDLPKSREHTIDLVSRSLSV